MECLSYKLEDDVTDIGVRAHIRDSVCLAKDISRALRCSQDNIIENHTGAELVYPTSYILQLANKTAQHPLFQTISQQLRKLYHLFSNRRLCPQWISPQLRLIEQKITELIPDDAEIVHLPVSKQLFIPNKSPSKKKKNSKHSKTRKHKKNLKCNSKKVNNSKKGKEIKKKCKIRKTTKQKTGYKYFENNILDQQHFKELYTKIDQINRKMNQLQQRLEGEDEVNKKNKSKKVPKKYRKKGKNKINHEYESACKTDRKRRDLLLKKMRKLDSLQQQAVCYMIFDFFFDSFCN